MTKTKNDCLQLTTPWAIKNMPLYFGL